MKIFAVTWVAFALLSLATSAARADPDDDAKIAAIGEVLDQLHTAASKIGRAHV